MSLTSKLALTMLASALVALAVSLLIRLPGEGGEIPLARTLQVAVLLTLLVPVVARRLGARLYRAPVARLLEHVRGIGEGDLERRRYPPRRDELGELGEELNRMSDRLRAARADDELRTRERLSTLEQLRHTERLTTVGKLASGIGHELGTPLHVVIARAKRILRREPPDGATAKDAESIAREGQRMSHLIRQMLAFSRPEAPRFAPVELSALVEEVAGLLRPMAERREVRLETRQGGDGAIEGDRDALTEVLANLTLNAIQATREEGEVELAVLEPVPDPDAPLRRYARVAIRDEGHGIPDALRQRIFEPFFTTREVGEGTGLGLSVAWGIVREHGGFIDVESEPGVGSRFTVHLPLPARTHAPVSAA